jgi:hypothetical protein
MAGFMRRLDTSAAIAPVGRVMEVYGLIRVYNLLAKVAGW